MTSDQVLQFLQDWGPWILAVVFAAVSAILKLKLTKQNWQEVIAILLGDVIANVLRVAHGQVDLVTEQDVRDAASVTYDKLTDMLPPKWHDVITNIVGKSQFQEWAWAAWQNWKATLDMPEATRALPV